MDLPKRKQNRLTEYDYNTAGAYFVTICTHERRNVLCEIVPTKNTIVGTPAPTKGNSVIARFVSTLKRFCNKEYDENIWQRSYHDHIIRDERDYREITDYIEDNPRKWAEDRYYMEQK